MFGPRVATARRRGAACAVLVGVALAFTATVAASVSAARRSDRPAGRSSLAARLPLSTKPDELRATVAGVSASRRLLLAGAAVAQVAPPPGPPPAVKGVKDGPPPAYVETGRGSTWLGFSSYCWKSTCADFIPARCGDKSTPTLELKRGELISFHLGFRPKSAVISFPRGKPQRLAARRVTSWRVRRSGFFSIMVYVRVGDANFDASYNGCIRLH